MALAHHPDIARCDDRLGLGIIIELVGLEIDHPRLAFRRSRGGIFAGRRLRHGGRSQRSEEQTSELQSLMRISYAVFCLKKNISKHVENESIQQKTMHQRRKRLTLTYNSTQNDIH